MGLSRRLEPGAAANLTGETGTYFYMAPEVFRHEVRRRVQKLCAESSPAQACNMSSTSSSAAVSCCSTMPQAHLHM